MSAELIWELSTGWVKPSGEAAAPVKLEHWINIARAAQIAGFHALRIPSGPRRPDAWLVAATLARHVRYIRFIVRLHPGLELPAIAARRAATLNQILDDRLDLEIAIGLDAVAHRTYGDPMNHDDRFSRAAEFLSVLSRAWNGRSSLGGFDHVGKHYRIQDGGLDRPPGVRPALYACGGTPGIETLAAAHVDTYYDWAQAPETLTERIRRIRVLAAEHRREVKHGCRIHIVAGRAPGPAWTQLQQEVLKWGARGDSTPVQVAPNLWTTGSLAENPDASEFTSVPGKVAIIAGSYDQVAERIAELRELGIDSFVLSSGEALEDLLPLAERIAPLTRGRGKPRGRGEE